MDFVRVTKLLEMAGRETTPDGEAVNAVRLARNIMEKGGKTFADLTPASGRVAPLPADFNVPYAEWKRRVEAAEAREAATATENAALKRENASLKRKAETAEETARARVKTDANGSMSYAAFAGTAITKLGGEVKAWMSVIEEQTDGAVTPKEIQHWRKKGRVPEKGVKALDMLRPTNEKLERAEWTPDRVDWVRRWVAEGMTSVQIAERLSRKFGATFHEGHVKRMRNNSIKRTGIFKDPAFGPPIKPPQ